MTTWDHIRAGLIAFHLVAITLAAIPTPDGRLTAANFKDPDVQETLRGWAPLGLALGVADSEDAFVDWLWARGQDIVAARRLILAPFGPYLKYCGQEQAWRMFGTVNRRVAYLEIHAQRDGAWEPLFVEHQTEPWAQRLLDQERVRAVRESWAKKKGKGSYGQFAAWIAERAARENPWATAVRVRYRAAVIGTPAEVRAGGGLLPGDVYWEEEFEVTP